ncbi:glycerophosphodiester phosphodiesterase [Streptomyces griseoviridis]|uniref:Glycerophosphodiester phosphodiesterase n=1 Tax=Streptomyces griseoviridis TaxID=45398 RepID=A0A3Q9KX84_STRGD|nr:glycerophosphodiester phosphodiesterase family protein [Streptomyces griseoviridis]AZS87926.1 glycerophosphodiester phosphodiesterase [Streptomyces griseoviridis]QCN85223.1 glycerophosphodiester phosphodiesterase [Streptomyces griseoviridis]
MYVRVVAAAATALLGAATLLLPSSDARARDVDDPPRMPAPSAPSAPPVSAPQVLAHRGASAYAPENTLAAVSRAAGLGSTWVENDVQRTKDGELVVIHDDTLARTTDAARVFPDRAPWKVRDFTAAEIARLDAGSWFGAAFTGTRVPTLARYLRAVERHHQNLLLEIKSPELYPGVERQIVKSLGDQGWLDARHLEHRLVVQSFSVDSLRTVHELEPGLRTAYLGRPATANLPAFASFTDGVNPSFGSLSTGYVNAAHGFTGPHGRPLAVFTWTVNDADTARKAAGLGVDGIITNKPDVIRAALPGS